MTFENYLIKHESAVPLSLLYLLPAEGNRADNTVGVVTKMATNFFFIFKFFLFCIINKVHEIFDKGVTSEDS